ncbi:MAG: amidohydrolase [Sphingomonadaceae bacterium]|nr:amidohydrolase [Sphingomonadaceae bacterium]
MISHALDRLSRAVSRPRLSSRKRRRLRELCELAALLCALSAVAPAFADGWVDNVNGITLDAGGQVVRFIGLVVSPDGKVVRLVKSGDRKPDKPDYRLDGKGRTLLPGLIDAHGHVIEMGVAALSLDLGGTASLDEAKARIAAYAAAHPDRRWISGGGWNQERWKLGRFPTAAELDAVVPDRPVWLMRADGHAGWANSAAMKEAGVTPTTKSPAGGRIEGGVFVDAAKALIQRAIPPLTSKDRDLALAKTQEILLGFGITGIADMGTSGEDWEAFRRAGDSGRLQVRIFSYSLGLEPMQAITAGAPTPWLYDDRLRMGGVKFYADGALGSRGACLKKPYADKPGESGLCFMDDAKMRNLMSRASMDGMQIAVHAIGDRANAQVLDAIADLAPTYGGDRRWRIEHAQIVDPADLPRFGKNGIVASMQPVHQTSDRTMAEARLGPDRLTGAYAWASMLRNGAHLAFGSDTPVESPNPFPGLAAAITREGADGEPFGGWQPQERITREQALAAFTTGAAYAAFAEDRIGRLAPGYRADFILIDTDPLQSTPAQLRATTVSEVWIGGKRVFRKP